MFRFVHLPISFLNVSNGVRTLLLKPYQFAKRISIHCLVLNKESIWVIWLIRSASTVFIFRELSSVSSSTKSFSGCQICIITLEYGMTIRTNHIKTRSDLSSSSPIPANEMRLSLPHPLHFSIMEILPLEDLPLFTTKTEAGANFLGTVRKVLISSPPVRQVNQLVDIARPFAKKHETYETILDSRIQSACSIQSLFDLIYCCFLGVNCTFFSFHVPLPPLPYK